MKIYFTVTLFSLIFIIKAYSQDLIIKKNGDNIKCKVIEISLTEVKYKKFENIDGPIYTLLSKEIESIKYENGTKDIFNGYKKNKIPFKFIDTSRIRYNIVKKKTISFFELSSFFNSEPGIFKSFIYNTRDPRLSYTTYYTNPLSIKFIEGIKFNNIFILGLSLEYTNIKPSNFFTVGSDIFINTSKQKNTPYINLNY